MNNEERKNLYMNRNIKLIPNYLALTWDVLFVWTISTMFFTTQKGLTYSQVIMLDSVQMAAGAIFAVLVPKIFAKIPSLRSTQIGMLGYGAYLLLSIIGRNYLTFMAGSIFLGLGYSIQAVKVNSLLTESLHTVKRDKDYQRVYGYGLSKYYVIEAIGSIVITYVYSWNAYSAYWLSFVVVVLTILYSLLLKEPAKFQDSNIDIDASAEIRVETKKEQKPDSYLKILSSSFVIALIVYIFLFRGILAPHSSAFRMFLQEMIDNKVIPLWMFGYLYAGFRLMSAISAKYQFKYNLKFGVRSLLIFNFCAVITYLVNSIAFIISPYSIITLIVVIIGSFIQASLRIPNQIFVNNYIQVCTHKKNQERVYALKTTIEYLSFSFMSFVYAQLLSGFNDNYGKSTLVYVAIFALPLIISMIVFIRLLCKKYASRYTIIKKEYTED